MSSNLSNDDNDNFDKPKKRPNKKGKKVKPIETDPIIPKGEFEKNIPLFKDKHYIKNPKALLKKIFKEPELESATYSYDEVKIDYVCADCERAGKAFCRMPLNKENLMTRVMNAVYMSHAMVDLFCPAVMIDLRMTDSKGELL